MQPQRGMWAGKTGCEVFLGENICIFCVGMLDTAEALLGAEEQPGCLLPTTGVGQGRGCWSWGVGQDEGQCCYCSTWNHLHALLSS